MCSDTGNEPTDNHPDNLCPACGNNGFCMIPLNRSDKILQLLYYDKNEYKKSKCLNCGWTVKKKK